MQQLSNNQPPSVGLSTPPSNTEAVSPTSLTDLHTTNISTIVHIVLASPSIQNSAGTTRVQVTTQQLSPNNLVSSLLSSAMRLIQVLSRKLHPLEIEEIHLFSQFLLSQMIQEKNRLLNDPNKKFSAADIEVMCGDSFNVIHWCGLYHLIEKATLTEDGQAIVFEEKTEKGAALVATLKQNPAYQWLTDGLIEIKKQLQLMTDDEKTSLLNFLSYTCELPKSDPIKETGRDVIAFRKITALKLIIDRKIINFDDDLPKEQQIPWQKAFEVPATEQKR